MKSLAERLAEEYELGPRDADSLEADVKALMQSLIMTGVVRDIDPDDTAGSGNFERREQPAVLEKIPEVPDEGTERWMDIAGITIRFRGKAEHFSENFEPFCVERTGKKGADICIQVTEEEPPDRGGLPFVLRGMTVTVQDGGDFYIMRSSETPAMREACIKKRRQQGSNLCEGREF